MRLGALRVRDLFRVISATDREQHGGALRTDQVEGVLQRKGSLYTTD